MRAIAKTDPSYPHRLHQLVLPPDPLYISGTLPPDDQKTLAIVGTRRSTPYGARLAREIAHVMATAGAVIVSGLAQGVDSIAHEATIAAGGITVAVLGEGLMAFEESRPLRRRRLAAAIREKGALVSEFALDVRATHWTFPRRNATIAALADAVVVIEAPVGSGSLITANHAFELGNPVFAVPGPLGASTWDGSNAYIADGIARLLRDPGQVAEVLGLQIGPRPDEAGAPILEVLAAGAADADTIAQALGTSVANTTAQLAELLLTGAVVPTGDGRFARAALR